jgi:hypothetical protein
MMTGVEHPYAYISEPLTGQSEVEAIKGFCRRVAWVCRLNGVSAYLPFEATDPKANPDVSPSAVYYQDTSMTISSDLCVFVVPETDPESVGLGMEMGYADLFGIPAIVVQHEGKKFDAGVQNMIDNNVELGRWKVLPFSGFDDENVLGELFETIGNMQFAVR